MAVQTKTPWSSAWEQVRGWLSQEKNRRRAVVAAGLAGMGLILLSEVWPSSPQGAQAGGAGAGEGSPYAQDSAWQYAGDYADDLERQLEELLSGIQGTGECQVMVTLSQGLEYIYASEDKTSQDQTQDLEGGSASRLQQKDTSEGKIVLLEDSSGSSQPLLSSMRQPQVNGVAVVCDGGHSAVVSQRVVETVSCVLGIRPSQVSVSPREATSRSN